MQEENPQYLVLIYSKYSSQCQRIIQVLSATPISYIKLLCIDNAKARQRLLDSKKLSIHTVPSVLFVYQNKIEKFEGVTVTDWVLSQIANLGESTETQLRSPSPEKSDPVDDVDYVNENGGMTALESLGLLDEQVHVEPTIIKSNKSISEIAAEMAGERDNMNPQNPNSGFQGDGLGARPL